MGLFGASVCQADDCGPAVYAYENRVVFYSCDKTGALGFNVVVLDDASDLKIAGRAAVTSKRSFDGVAHYKDQLLILTWDLLEIFDTADPGHPNLAAKFSVKKQGSFPGYDRIVKESDSTFLVLSSVGPGELTLSGNTPQWTYKDIDRTPEHTKMTAEWSAESRLSREVWDVMPILETAKFRYELIWKDKKTPGQVHSREYVRKVDKATQKSVSALLIGEKWETID